MKQWPIHAFGTVYQGWRTHTGQRHLVFSLLGTNCGAGPCPADGPLSPVVQSAEEPGVIANRKATGRGPRQGMALPHNLVVGQFAHTDEHIDGLATIRQMMNFQGTVHRTSAFARARSNETVYSEVSAVNLRSRLKLARDLYCADERPWVVAFSGGKDSTAILQLIWMALTPLTPEARSKAVDVCYVDTGMDHPLYREQVAKTLERIEAVSKQECMPFRFHVIEPELRHRYFVAVLGRGYAPPTHWFRWCTKGMRIRPMSKFIKNTLSLSGSVVIVLGLRSSESQSRKQILENFSRGVSFLSNYGSLKNASAFTPIEDFSKEEVWQFLMQAQVPWRGRNLELVQLYSAASGGECTSYSAGGGMGPSCGGSRFGCWTCTVIRQDKSGALSPTWMNASKL
jgi:3'-phosphoadenosine 5'-phosphosulfate sulfotransferase (PAPS reductase)/FAD synthetase